MSQLYVEEKPLYDSWLQGGLSRLWTLRSGVKIWAKIIMRKNVPQVVGHCAIMVQPFVPIAISIGAMRIIWLQPMTLQTRIPTQNDPNPLSMMSHGGESWLCACG